jgi:CDP-diacylglycerol--glycerol-3-phosphate 3-phosphatidyltransferase
VLLAGSAITVAQRVLAVRSAARGRALPVPPSPPAP